MTAMTAWRSRIVLPPICMSFGASRDVYWMGLSYRSSSSIAAGMSLGSRSEPLPLLGVAEQ